MKHCMAVLLMLVLLTAFPYSAQARATWQVEGGGTYTYEPRGDGSCAILSWKGDLERLVIPEKIAGFPVTAIGVMAFQNKQFKEVLVPNSVRQIGNMAFARCASLERATLPEGLESLSKALFFGCTGLKEVNIPSGATEIGEMAFDNCAALTSVSLPEGLTSIGISAFQGCASLEEIHLPEGLTSIGNNGFFGCESLKQLDLPEGLVELGWGAFNRCWGIREMTLPDSLSQVGYNPFAYMELDRLNVSPDHPFLDYVDGVLYSKADNRLVGCAEPKLLPARYEVRAGTEIVDECAFCQCRNLESIALPDSVHTIKALAFAGCDGLSEIRWSAGLKEIWSWTFHGCDALTELILPEGLEKLSGYAIDNCPNLERVVIPASAAEVSGSSVTECPKAVLVVARNSAAERVLREAKVQYIYPDGSKPTPLTQGVDAVVNGWTSVTDALTDGHPEDPLASARARSLLTALGLGLLSAVLIFLSGWRRKG